MALFNFFGGKKNEASRDFSESIRHALEAFADDRLDHWEKVVEAIEARTSDKELAIDLFRFLPIAYTRILLPDVNLSAFYLILDSKGAYTKYRLDENPLYIQIMQYFEKYGIAEEEEDGLLGFNSEIDSINKALHAGSKLEDLEVSPPVFL